MMNDFPIAVNESTKLVKYCEFEGFFYIPDSKYHKDFNYNSLYFTGREINSCKSSVFYNVICNMLVLISNDNSNSVTRVNCFDALGNEKKPLIIKGYMMNVIENNFNIYILLSIIRFEDLNTYYLSRIIYTKSLCVDNVLYGTISMMSHFFSLKCGIIFFVEIINEKSSKILLLFTNSALFLHGYLSVGDKLAVISSKRFINKSCKNKSGNTSFNFVVDSHFNIVEHEVNICKNAVDYKHLKDILSDNNYLQDVSGMEINFICNVEQIYSNGWLEVSSYNTNNEQILLGIYLPHSLHNEFRFVFKNCELAMQRLVPVILWGKVVGFAFTSRSFLSVRKYPLITQQCITVFSVPEEIRDGSHLYSAFRFDFSHKLKKAVKDLDYWSKSIESCVLDVVEGNFIHDVNLYQNSNVTSCETIDNYVDNISSNILIKKPNVEMISDYVICVTNYNNACGNINPIGLRVKLKLRGKRAVYEEFFDKWVANLYSVRACLDLDFICNYLLPKVVSTSNLKTYMEDNITNMLSKSAEKISRVYKFLDFSFICDHCFDEKFKNICLVASIVELECTSLLSLYTGKDAVVRLKLIDSENCIIDLFITELEKGFCSEILNLYNTCNIKNTNSSSRIEFPAASCGIHPVVVAFHLSFMVEENFGRGEEVYLAACCPSRWIKIVTDISLLPLSYSFSSFNLNNQHSISTVRELLEVSLSPHKREIFVPLIEGVILSKHRSEDDYYNDTIIDKKRKVDSEIKYRLVLRDRLYPDSISIYLSQSLSDRILPGTIVWVTKSILCLSEKKQNVYLKEINDKTLVLSVGIVDFPQLKKINEYNLISILHKVHLNYGDNVLKPPETTIKDLYKLTHDRCMWTITGEMIYLRKIVGFLRCSSCHFLFKGTTLMSNYCERCNLHKCNEVWWEANIAFDDGTGVCNISLEGEDFFLLLQSKYDTERKLLKLIQHKLHQMVLTSGNFYYDAYEEFCKLNSTVVLNELNITETVLDPKNEKSFSEYLYDYKNDGRLAFLIYVKSLQYSKPCEIVCKINHFNTIRKYDNFEGGNHMKLKFQKINHESPHSVSFTYKDISTNSKIVLKGLSLNVLEGNKLRLKAWKIFNNLI